VFFYNPNIHPYTEYKSRADTLKDFCKNEGLPLIEHGGYGLRDFLALTAESREGRGRCRLCYAERLDTTAKYAAENGFEGFSTTLLISPYQDHESLKEIGERAAARFGTEFLYRDFRPLFRAGQAMAREKTLYMQKYCGCIFSEEERYIRN
jgi:predicted adenine nucleotide alpha hydrolase (AANH) superfamily ATPase